MTRMLGAKRCLRQLLGTTPMPVELSCLKPQQVTMRLHDEQPCRSDRQSLRTTFLLRGPRSIRQRMVFLL